MNGLYDGLQDGLANGLHSDSFGKLNKNHVLNRGLVGYWPLQDGVGTKCLEIVNGYNATSSLSTSWGSSKFGYAMNFTTNTGNTLTYDPGVSVDPSKLNITGPISFGGWVYPTLTNRYQLIVAKAINDGTSRQWALYLSGLGTSQIYVSLAGTSIPNTSLAITTPWVANKWNHVMVTYNGSIMMIHVNGRIVNTTTVTGTMTTINFSKIHIGNSNEVSNYSLSGATCEIRVYNRALTPTEVQMLYNNPRIDWKHN